MSSFSGVSIVRPLKSLLLASVPAMLIGLSPVHSADLGVDIGELFDSNSVYDWSGLYFGAHAAIGDGTIKTSNGTSSLSRSFDSGDKTAGGVLLGWNFQHGQFVYGVESALSINEIKSTYTGGTLNYHTSDYVWHVEARARAGYAVGRFLPYVAAGVVAGEFYQQSGFSLTGPTGALKSVSGYTLGAGVDVKLYEGLALRTEYLYQNMSKHDYQMTSVPTTLSTDFDVHLGRVALLYHFGNPLTSPTVSNDMLFSGPSLGLYAGGTTGDVKLSRFATGSTSNQTAAAGIKLGYLYPIDSFRVGAEATIDMHSGSSKFDPGGAVTEFDYRLMWTASLRAKAGYVFDRFMPYVTAGLNLGQFTANAQPNNNTVLAPYKNGYSFGGGLEYAVTDRMNVDLGYTYNSYSKAKINTSGSYTNVGHDIHQVRLGLVLR